MAEKYNNTTFPQSPLCKRNMFVFHLSEWWWPLRDNPELRKETIDALCEYVATGIIPEGLSEAANALLRVFSVRLLDDIEKHPNSRMFPPVDESGRGSVDYIHWRKAVLKRDNYTCQMCGSTKHLNAHHIKLFSEYPELRFDIDNGITLCKRCHIDVHRKRH